MVIEAGAPRLEDLGWNATLADAHAEHDLSGRVPARVVAEDRGSYRVLGPAGEQRAAVTGRFRFETNDPADYPAVGDWVAVEAGLTGDTIIHAVLPRRSALIRQAAGRRTEAQVVGANLDVVFVVASLNGDLNLRRLERYVAVAWESGAEPVVLLSKADLTDDVEAILAGVSAIAAGASVLIVSSFDGRGVDAVRARIGPGRTAAFVGSSGVGKSTLLNKLAGEERASVSEIREGDARGRHTTIRRQIHLLPEGGLVLDTPGMRELALWDGDGLEQSFAEIDELATACRFGDCAHDAEPGCAVGAAIAAGTLAVERLESWRKLQREARHHERQVNVLARNEERRKWKAISKSVGKHMDAKYGADRW
ncbi:MAG TPA: ribosome small subunit-dependent GTPase A [Candidatus Limnocylindrales bacterium]|jgi:ribosome biogenesis GTPase